MLTKSFLLLTFLAAAVRAVIVPKDLSDGVWDLWEDEDGSTVAQRDTSFSAKFAFEKARNAAAARRATAASPTGSEADLFKRQYPNCETGCTGGDTYDHDDYITAVTLMQGYCDGGAKVGTRNSKVFSAGSAMVYICNSSGIGGQGCSRTEWDHFNELMDINCGLWKGSYTWINDWAKTYGRDVAGARICN
ncbi:hypothetical protein UCRPA7_4370 [Phaeoacremonium minimum UCRPA7]|uniref:Uncharacterized protein n=1 Tax=Phaeoacremonium minimum (strain UCR-PA7) TaxID=1286976 RepID=R8BLK0_PHAM7|nr:hypothetical protein UCRPA7_4370 [Phaeoacremonium minimum UCRPA7]EOO00150.1 hypothetical protein UCRPA7_4370 [Phaeoacremonium minimum UCRPA7]